MNIPEYKPWSLIDYKKTPPTHDEHFFQEFLNKTNCANLQEYEIYAKIIESLQYDEEIDPEKLNTKWFVRIFNESKPFSNLNELSELLLDILEENTLKEFEVIFDNPSLKIHNRRFFVKINKWNIVVDYKRYSIWILFDTNFWIEKNKKPGLMDFYDTIKANKWDLDLLKELGLYVIKMERNWNYFKDQENEIIKHFRESIKTVNKNYAWHIEQITNFSLYYFTGLFNFLIELKKENNWAEFEDIIKNLEITQDNEYISLNFIKENSCFFKKFYDKIILEKWAEKHKRPMLGDWLIVHYSIIKNIYAHPSKCILISDDKDIYTISKLFIEFVLPRFVCFNTYSHFEKNFSETFAEMSLEESMKQDWLTKENSIDNFFKTIKELVKFFDGLKPQKSMIQVLSTYKPSSQTVINYHISSILFDALICKPKALVFLSNVCIVCARLWISIKQFVENKLLLTLSSAFLEEDKIISLTKSELIMMFNERKKIVQADKEKTMAIKEQKKKKKKIAKQTKRKQRK